MSDELAAAPKSQPFKVSRISPLARRLVAATVAFSTAVALLATAAQLYIDYRHDLDDIEQTFQQVDQTYLPTITNALWATSRKEIQIALDGLVQLPDLRYVEVAEKGQLWGRAGIDKTTAIKARDYPLTHMHRDRVETIGTLRVVVDLDGVYRRLIDKFWVILISNSIKTFFVAGFMLWLFRWLVTRHLRRIADFAARLGIDNLDERLSLDRGSRARSAPDEFDSVLAGFNQMQANLTSTVADLKQEIAERIAAESERSEALNTLHQTLSELERRVEQRTQQVVDQARIIDEIHDAVITTDINFNVTTWNRGAERLFGYSAAEILGQPLHRLYPPETAPLVDERIFMPLRELGQHEVETRMRRKSGTVFYVQLSLSVLHDRAGAPRGFVAYTMDITARKQAEALAEHRTAELETVNRELETFSYSVSHDLRAPLRSIDGFSKALLEDYGDRLDTNGHSHLTRVRDAAQRMGLLIDDLLRLARVTRADMYRTRVDITALAGDVIANIDEDHRDGPVDTAIQPGLVAYGDVALLRIVLENLLNNAYKYTSKTAHPRIEVGAKTEKGRTVFFVRDNGAGFDMNYAYKLFRAFQRLHRSEEFPGTGVGLATVQRIIHRHGGEVWAEGRPEAGAAFYFTLSELDLGDADPSGSLLNDSPNATKIGERSKAPPMSTASHGGRRE